VSRLFLPDFQNFLLSEGRTTKKWASAPACLRKPVAIEMMESSGKRSLAPNGRSGSAAPNRLVNLLDDLTGHGDARSRRDLEGKLEFDLSGGINLARRTAELRLWSIQP
jgi:hypothetical protein